MKISRDKCECCKLPQLGDEPTAANAFLCILRSKIVPSSNNFYKRRQKNGCNGKKYQNGVQEK